MNEQKMIPVFIAIGAAGSCRKESWFLEKGLTTDELNAAIELGYLVKHEKDPNELTSNTSYELTQEGRDFAWRRN